MDKAEAILQLIIAVLMLPIMAFGLFCRFVAIAFEKGMDICDELMDKSVFR